MMLFRFVETTKAAYLLPTRIPRRILTENGTKNNSRKSK